MTKPILKSSTFNEIFEIENDEINEVITEVNCGKCGEMLGISQDQIFGDFKYFQEHYCFCHRCGEPIDWS